MATSTNNNQEQDATAKRGLFFWAVGQHINDRVEVGLDRPAALFSGRLRLGGPRIEGNNSYLVKLMFCSIFLAQLAFYSLHRPGQYVFHRWLCVQDSCWPTGSLILYKR